VSEETDEALMCTYRDGDAAAFDRLYERHRGPVYRYFRRQVQPPEAVDELFQDVWMRVIDARASYEPRAKFTTWLYTIAHNRLMDFYRSRQRASFESLDAEDSGLEEPAIPDTALPESIAERKETAAQLLSALAALPAAQREAFLLHEEGELTLEEIAALLGTQRETVKSRIRYALAKLRRTLTATAGIAEKPAVERRG
jgi:RNA polymerase sigma factor (sigma-70 family)